jgi:protein-S-isoprenylcysteine O-methyltransferase Ste14
MNSARMQNPNLSPHTYAATVLATTFGSFFLFSHFGHYDRLFFLPIFAVAMLWAGANFARQLKHGGTFAIDSRATLASLFRRSLARYLVWLVILFLGISFYSTHSFYSRYEETIYYLESLLNAYLILGLPYFLITLKLRASRTEDFYDPAVRIILIARRIAAGVLRHGLRRKAFVVLRSRYNRKTLLNLVMRGYFIPVMVVQVYSGFSYCIQVSDNDFNHYAVSYILVWISSMLWLADSMSASASYSIESRWMENRSRSVDLTASGWLICLCCYPPLNDITGTLFPFAPNVVDNQLGSMLIPDMAFLYVSKIIEIVLLLALVYADLSLGPSGVNITLKRLQTRGPYGIVRHPATVCKLTLWWLQSAFYLQFWSWEMILGQLMWNVIYISRALTEERHLKQFPEYREYMKKVKYRFIPGVF